MKKKIIKLDKALSLDKETIARLNEEQLNSLEGGGLISQTCTCNGTDKVQTDSTVCSCQACSCNI